MRKGRRGISLAAFVLPLPESKLSRAGRDLPLSPDGQVTPVRDMLPFFEIKLKRRMPNGTYGVGAPRKLRTG